MQVACLQHLADWGEATQGCESDAPAWAILLHAFSVEGRTPLGLRDGRDVVDLVDRGGKQAPHPALSHKRRGYAKLDPTGSIWIFQTRSSRIVLSEDMTPDI